MALVEHIFKLKQKEVLFTVKYIIPILRTSDAYCLNTLATRNHNQARSYESLNRRLGIISHDLGRNSFMATMSNDAFRLFAFVLGSWSALILYVLYMSLTTGKTKATFLEQAMVSIMVLIVSAIPLFVVFISARARKQRRAYRPELLKHFSQEKLVVSQQGICYTQPTSIRYPFKDTSLFGTAEENFWPISAIQRLSIYRAKSGKVTALDIKVDDLVWVLNHFENRDQLAEVIKQVTPSLVHEELPRLIPLGIQVIFVALGIAAGIAAIWFLFRYG